MSPIIFPQAELSVDEKLARLRAHRNNIGRYRRLLKTQLSELERGFILKRLGEETEALQNISLAFPMIPPAERRRTEFVGSPFHTDG